MHLFFVDQYISFDMMAPIIHRLSKKNKIFFYNFNKVQTFDNNKVHNFIVNQKNIYEVKNLTSFFSQKFFFLVLINFIFFLPTFILKKGFKFWRYIWVEFNFVSKEKLIKFIKENKIKTMSIDESLVEKKRRFLTEISKELNIPLIMNHGGLYTIKAIKKNDLKFKESSFFLSPNILPILTYKFKKNYIKSGKYKQFGSPRFDLEWMKILEKIYKKKTKNDNKKIKVAFFLRPTSFSYDGIIKLLNQLKVMNNIEIKLNYKPRDVFPTKCSNISKSDMQSSELIMWSDIVITYASSIILEAVCRDKPIIYLDYIKIDDKNDISWFDELKFIKKAKKLDDVIKGLKSFNRNKQNYIITSRNKMILLKKFITSPNAKNILTKYNSFYYKLVS